MSRKKRIRRLAAALAAASGALFVATASAHGTAATLTIRHQVHGCHSWSFNNGAYKPALTVQLSREVTVAEVNDVFKAAAESGPLEGYLQYSTDPLVSTDINQSPYSCIFDSGLTMASGTTAKVFGWYDNEWGYSCRLVDLVNIVGKSL